MKKLISAIAIMAFLSIAFVSLAGDPVPPIPPLPKRFEGIKIVKPDPTVPKEITDFLGEWEGAWKWVGTMRDSRGISFGQETRRTKLIVYEVSTDKIKILYGWGSEYERGKGGWRLFETDITTDNGKKRFSFIGQWRMGFYLEDGILKGSSGGNYEAEMKRVK